MIYRAVDVGVAHLGLFHGGRLSLRSLGSDRPVGARTTRPETGGEFFGARSQRGQEGCQGVHLEGC